MNVPFIRIKTKFIILFSSLIAVVLLLQFYFMDRAQKETIDELNQMSHRINAATDIMFIDEGIESEEILSPDHRIREIQKPDAIAVLDEDKDDYVIRVETKSVDLDCVRTSIYTTVRRKPKDKIRKIQEDLEKKTKDRDKSEILEPIKWVYSKDSSYLADKTPTRLIQRVSSNDDSSTIFIEEIHANAPGPGDKTFSFMVPNLKTAGKPGLVRYNYNTQKLYTAFEDARFRNVIVTILLLLISILGIFLIARSFEKPIHDLRDSFVKLEAGDLDVMVGTAGNDEIGQLGASFNVMVDELRKNREKEQLLNRKERFTALGQLAAGVAHEIKNPLNAINLTITHLRDKFVDGKDDAAISYIKSIQEEINRLDKTVTDFFNYVRSDNLEKKETDIHILLDEICLLYDREIKHNQIELNKNYGDQNFILQVDGERFKTALVNIILNAIQAMSKGGELELSTDAVANTITIRDTGPGIPKKDLANIFDFFYTTKSGGSGLGLPAAYKIIKAHKGEIHIRSTKEKGTLVIIQMQKDEK